MGGGIGGAKRGQVQPGVTVQRRAHFPGDGRIADGGEHFQIAGLEHHALIGAASRHGCLAAAGSVGMLAIGCDQEAQTVEQRGCCVYVRYPVGEMIQKDGIAPRKLDGGCHLRQTGA